MLLTHFIWQTDLKPLSGTNAKNGAIPLSLTWTIHTGHARCYKASEWVGEFTVQARYLGVVLGDLVDVAVWGNVPCVSKIDTLDFSTVY